MTGEQLLLAYSVSAALLATLAGLFATRRLQQCLSFGVYAGVVAGCDLLITVFPERFYNASFWMARQALYDVLKVAVALELAYRVVRAFPVLPTKPSVSPTSMRSPLRTCWLSRCA